MLTSLVAVDRVDMCAKLCSLAQKMQKPQIYFEPTSKALFYAAYSRDVDCEHDAIVAVHDVRYGPNVCAPSKLVGVIEQSICSVIEQMDARPTIDGVVLCGFHQSAIVAHCTSVCVQRIIACNNLNATQLPNIHCVTFGLPLYYIHPARGTSEHTHVMMNDDWYVLTPFTIVVTPVHGLLWIGTEDLVSYVCNKIESLFRTVRSKRTMCDYTNAFMAEYEELLTTHCEEVGTPPPPSPNDTFAPTVEDVDWIDCVEDSSTIV